jgi:hypothetical protein
VIPNIVHFIYPVNSKTRPFSSLNIQAVKRAATIQKPDTIRFWTNAKPGDIAGWGEIASMIDLIPTIMPEHEWPQYQSDTLRLNILYDQGGIYMDTDLLTLRPMPMFEDSLTISWESEKRESVSNALMISAPRVPFIAEWMRRLPQAQSSSTWAYGGVVLPAEMIYDSSVDTDDIIMMPPGFCCPLDLSKAWLTEPELKEEAQRRVDFSESHGIHCFETFWRHRLPGWEQRDCLLRDLAI